MKLTLSGKQVLSSSETARLLGISVSSVRNWVRHGFISSVSNDNEYLFLKDDVLLLRSRIEKGELDRLNSRANKTVSSKTFLPDELFENDSARGEVAALSEYIRESGIDPSLAMFVVCLSVLKKNGLINDKQQCDIIQSDRFQIRGRKNLVSSLTEWRRTVAAGINEQVLKILDYPLPVQGNIAGIIYQSILVEGEKSKLGSYYTPDWIVNRIAERMCGGDMIFLDPCCGTGQFILSFADISGSPENIYGIDIDPVAVNVARINLMIRFGDIDFEPKIFCNDSLMNYNESLLFDSIDSLPEFDVIATNPPWGSHYRREELSMLRYLYPEISSGESFSCFLVKSMRMLKKGGRLSFLLPESVLNVKMHHDIRNYILDNAMITRIEKEKRIFRNVFSSAVIIDIIKGSGDGSVEIVNNDRSYHVSQTRFMNSCNNIFDINITPEDERLISRVFSRPHVTLRDRAKWALGIVTGNNREHIKSECGEGAEPVIKGKDIHPFRISEGGSYVRFEPAKFQQTAAEHFYRHKNKLVYRYISNRLIFACDRDGRVTLNSANILIPEIEGYTPGIIAGLFNSELYQFIFQKKFSSVKVLRSHIEELPVPDLTEDEKSRIEGAVASAELSGDVIQLNRVISGIFRLSDEEADYIKENII
ncbi:MAG TPA: N-6 DNA methylase [Spirochaetota bacterium]|nr:N-6 DNA methylase [Spirochaetota bacterium]HPJ35958.1 N-6 DNA methylase [Spirochaetota bacterium]